MACARTTIFICLMGENDDRGGAGGMSIAPSSDAIAEFRALTSNYSADYGLSSGGTMTMVLKSGTSTLHASAWEFIRNDALDARNFFNPEPQKVAKLRQNVFGFNVGGPVTLGKLYNPDRKKTFFFYNMEWRRYIQRRPYKPDCTGLCHLRRQLQLAGYPDQCPDSSQVAASVSRRIALAAFCRPASCRDTHSRVTSFRRA